MEFLDRPSFYSTPMKQERQLISGKKNNIEGSRCRARCRLTFVPFSLRTILLVGQRVKSSESIWGLTS